MKGSVLLKRVLERVCVVLPHDRKKEENKRPHTYHMGHTTTPDETTLKAI
jgi:hypothetical protein